MWQDGKTPDEIARARELTCSTVLGHLEVLILKGRPVDLSRIVPAEKQQHSLRKHLTRAQEDRLSSVKELLQEAATYDEIRLVKGCGPAITAKKHRRIELNFTAGAPYKPSFDPLLFDFTQKPPKKSGVKEEVAWLWKLSRSSLSAVS